MQSSLAGDFLDMTTPINNATQADNPRASDNTILQVLRPLKRTAPIVFASPHSGRHYPAPFLSASRLDSQRLRRSEDAFIDEIFAAAPEFGAPMLQALFPRAFVDPNREAFELDPSMFTGKLPASVKSSSPRIEAGLGTIAKVVTNGEEIYDGKLTFIEAKERIETYYQPYHKSLKGLINETVEQFGVCLLIDCHSMPSIGGPMDSDDGKERVDMVLGDRYGISCSDAVTNLVETTLSGLDYRAVRNAPYAGGFTTAHYGEPAIGVHALQIEINRALYMNEKTMERTEGHGPLTTNMTTLIKALTAIDIAALRP